MSVLEALFSGDDERAEAALAQLEPGHLPDLERALARGEPDVAWWAVRGMAQLPGTTATAALARAAAHANPDVRAGAIYLLGERGTAAQAALLQALDDENQYIARLATDALVRLGRAAVPALIAALGASRSARVRAGAARALAAIGDTRAIPALFKALEDDSSLVQYWADEGLEKMGVGQVYFKP